MLLGVHGRRNVFVEIELKEKKMNLVLNKDKKYCLKNLKEERNLEQKNKRLEENYKEN